MNLKTQRRIAAQLLNCPQKRVCFSQEKLADIKAAITRADIRGLINKDIIKARSPSGSSRGRIRLIKRQKRKGRRQGQGSREGTHKARMSKKEEWMQRIRAQRKFLDMLRKKSIVRKNVYRSLYSKSKGGQFRSVRHIKSYLEEHKLAEDVKKTKKPAVQKKKAR